MPVVPHGTYRTYGIPQGLAAYVASLIDRTLDWNDIKWLRTICGNMKVRFDLKRQVHGGTV